MSNPELRVRMVDRMDVEDAATPYEASQLAKSFGLSKAFRFEHFHIRTAMAKLFADANLPYAIHGQPFCEEEAVFFANARDLDQLLLKQDNETEEPLDQSESFNDVDLETCRMAFRRGLHRIFDYTATQ